MCRWNRACDQPPWSCLPGASSVRSAIGSSRPFRSASTRPCSRPTTATSAPCPRPSNGTSGASRKSSATRAVSGTDAGSARTLQTLSGPSANTASPCAPSRSNSPSKNCFEPLEVGLQSAANLVGQVGPRRAVRLRRQVEQRMDPRRRVAGGRDAARIEVEVEADRAAVLGPEGRKLAQTVEADHRCRHTALSA